MKALKRDRPFSFTRFDPEERGNMFLRNVGTRLQDYTVYKNSAIETMTGRMG
jgi:hypothetical protein